MSNLLILLAFANSVQFMMNLPTVGCSGGAPEPVNWGELYISETSMGLPVVDGCSGESVEPPLNVIPYIAVIDPWFPGAQVIWTVWMEPGTPYCFTTRVRAANGLWSSFPAEVCGIARDKSAAKYIWGGGK